MSSLTDSEPKAKKLKVEEKQKKQVKFGYVENRYYERKAGFLTNEKDIQIISCYLPFATTKTYFDEHDRSKCVDCMVKKQNAKKPERNGDPEMEKKEKINAFYNIHGPATRRHNEVFLGVKKRLRLLLEAGVGREEIAKSICEQGEFVTELKALEEKETAREAREKEMKQLRDEHEAAASEEEREELREEIEETEAHIDEQQEQNMEWMEEVWEEERRELIEKYDRLMAEVLSEMGGQKEASGLACDSENIVSNVETLEDPAHKDKKNTAHKEESASNKFKNDCKL